MRNQYYFISGLPRSGSTLLASILRQNIAYHAGISSPVASLVNSCLEQVGAGSEFSSFFDEEKRKGLMRAIFAAYYDEHQDKKIIFDTNRLWSARLHQLVEVFTDTKIVCCVRNPAWVMDSFERIYRKNPFDYSRMFNASNRTTVYSRCESLIQAVGTVGSAWTALKEAYYGEFSERLLIVDYNLLAQYPARTMALLYEFLDLPPYSHDFDNVGYEESEFDLKLGVKGLHSVDKKVTFTTRRTVLPPDLFSKYSEMAFWQDQVGTSSSVIASKSESSALSDQ